MKKKKTGGMITALLLLIIIVITAIGVYMKINKDIKMQKDDSIVSNMLAIKSSCKVYNENRIRTKSEDPLIGTKVADIKKNVETKNDNSNDQNTDNQNNKSNSQNDNSKEQNNDNENDKSNGEETDRQNDNSNERNINNEYIELIEELKNNKAISEEEYEKYYLLTDKDLEQLKIDVKNEKGSYYLINYETNEVVITKGYEGRHKLSEIEKAIEEAKNNANNKNKDENDKNEKDKSDADNKEHKDDTDN